VTKVVAGLAFALTVCGGCSLVSGWNDLQDGARAGLDASAPAPVDSGADATGGETSAPPGLDSGSPIDSATGGSDASSVLTTVACGSTRCPVGEGCCAGILGGSTCQTPAQACSPPSTYQSCSDSTQCTASLGHPAQCCQETSGITVSCSTSCATPADIVCDPTLASPSCPAGTTCRSAPGFGYNTCQ
jgi:hypothetical protein